MKKTLSTVALSALLVGGFGLGMTADAQETVSYSAALSGANEVGDAGGDTDGSGSATVTIDAAGGEVCFDISYTGIDAVAAGHIHSGGAGANGPVVVDFALNDTTTDGCVSADATTITSILNAPSLFYVNIHTAEFPDGAIRGQLVGAPAAAATPEPTAEATPEPTAEATTEATAEPTPEATEATEDDADAAAPAAAAGDGEELAFTGDMTGALGILGSAMVVAGAGALVAARRRR